VKNWKGGGGRKKKKKKKKRETWRLGDVFDIGRYKQK
jgi:hypothetical protein